MRIQIVTPAPPGSTKGNRITALRWSQILREIGHRVTVTQEFSGRRCDLLIALHARRSAQSIHRFRRDYPNRPLLVALTGTDLYGDLRTNSSARRSLALATRLIVLQPDGKGVVPGAGDDGFHGRVTAIFDHYFSLVGVEKAVGHDR